MIEGLQEHPETKEKRDILDHLATQVLPASQANRVQMANLDPLAPRDHLERREKRVSKASKDRQVFQV